jgi:hypothetical protein
VASRLPLSTHTADNEFWISEPVGDHRISSMVQSVPPRSEDARGRGPLRALPTLTGWRDVQGGSVRGGRCDRSAVPVASVQPSVGFPVTTTCAVFGSAALVSDISGFFTVIRTQYRIANPCENATGFVSPLS